MAVAGIFILRDDAHRLFEELVTRGLPLVVVSGAAGVTALVVAAGAPPRVLRLLAVVAVGTVIAGWGVAQYPYLLGTHVTIGQGAAPNATLWADTAVFAAAALLCVPSLALLYVLQQRGQLEAT
jgi:cytochrome d ubiquinol oxidase subunit II